MIPQPLAKRLVVVALLGHVLAVLFQGLVASLAMYVHAYVRFVPVEEINAWSVYSTYVAASVAAVIGFAWGTRYGKAAAVGEVGETR